MRLHNYVLIFSMIATISFNSQAKREARESGVLAAQQGENCTSLKGKAKRVCKRTVRKAARLEAKEKCGGGLFKGGKCRREIRRDKKARQGAFSGVGAKSANQQGIANSQAFKQERKALKQQYRNGLISKEQYKLGLEDAEASRMSANNKVGRKKNLKTALVVGALATGGVAGAVGAGGGLKVGEKIKQRKLKRSAAGN